MIGLDRQREERKLINAITDIWGKIFLPRNLDADRWVQATYIACSLEGREYATISPTLMQEALRQEEARRLSVATQKPQSEHRAQRPTITAKLWRWTGRKMAEHRPIMEYMPTEGQVTAAAMKLGLTQEEAREQRQLLRAYLNDWIYAYREHKPFDKSIWLDENHEVSYRGFC